MQLFAERSRARAIAAIAFAAGAIGAAADAAGFAIASYAAVSVRCGRNAPNAMRRAIQRAAREKLCASSARFCLDKKNNNVRSSSFNV